MLMLMRAGILVGGMVVVAVEVMVVVVVGVMSFSEERCFSVTEVKCVGVGCGLVGSDIFDFSGGFVAVVVEMVVGDLNLEIGAVVRTVRSCVNGELYFLWCLSQKSLEVKMSNVGGDPFVVVMREDSLIKFLLFDGSCLGEEIGSTKEVLVVEMVVGMVESMVLADLGLLLEVVILVQVMVWGWT